MRVGLLASLAILGAAGCDARTADPSGVADTLDGGAALPEGCGNAKLAACSGLTVEE